MNGGISTCPKTRKIFQCGDFAQSMSISQKNVWDSFRAVVDGFLGNRKDDRYEAESVIRENKNPRIAKIAQTRKLGDREKKRIYSI